MVRSLVISGLTLRYLLFSALNRNVTCVCMRVFVCLSLYVFPPAEPSPWSSQRQWPGGPREMVEEGTFGLQKKIQS